VILVSPYFPPSGLAGVHRARHLSKHLPAAGWTPIVLCVDQTCYEERLDPLLTVLVPKTVEVVKTRALPACLARRIGVGDIGLRSWIALRQTLFRLFRTKPIKAVLITGSPYYPMLIAPEIKRHFRIPVVLDFQDPWVEATSNSNPVLSKASLAQGAAKLLEPRALRGASFVTSVSDMQNQEMSLRYAWLDASRMAGIPIGADPDDFTILRDRFLHDRVDLNPNYINLSYVGTFWPAVRGSMYVVLRAFAQLRARMPDVAHRIKLNFIGTNANPNDVSTFHVRPLAEAEGVADAVMEVPGRVSYLAALDVLSRSDGILLIGSHEPHYTASKIYPALMSQRPFLSLFHRASSAHAILSAAGGGGVFAFGDPQELASLEVPLADGLGQLAAAPESLGRVRPAVYAHYEARAIASRFAAIFDLLEAENTGKSHNLRR
jgi:hypothetical protein